VVEVSAATVVFSFHVSRLFLSRRRLEGHVSVDWRSIGGGDRRDVGLPMGMLPPTNVDWRSNSSLDTQRKRLQDYYDAEKKYGFPWMQIIQWAAQRVDQFATTAGDFEVASHYEQVEANYLIQPIWPANGVTVWFGQGEVCKGQMAIAAGVSLSMCQNLAGLKSKSEGKGIIYVDYEDDFDEFSVRVSRYINGLGVGIPSRLRRFDARGRIFTDIADQLRAKIKADGGADGLIIDSALPAVAGEANEPEPVGAFFNALDWIKLPALVIAHETKMANDEFPFGSQLWRTRARMNVNFQAGEEAQTADGDFMRDILLRCTKANNVRRFHPLAFRLTFTDDESPGQAPARTWVRQLAPGDVSLDLHRKLPNRDRLRAFLAGMEPLTVSDISEATGIDGKVVAETLRRYPQIFESAGGGRGKGNAAVWSVSRG